MRSSSARLAALRPAILSFRSSTRSPVCITAFGLNFRPLCPALGSGATGSAYSSSRNSLYERSERDPFRGNLLPRAIARPRLGNPNLPICSEFERKTLQIESKLKTFAHFSCGRFSKVAHKFPKSTGLTFPWNPSHPGNVSHTSCIGGLFQVPPMLQY